jgi:hypothetical protein
MRALLALMAAAVLGSCVTPQKDPRFQLGQEPTGFVMIGVAESAANTSPDYIMLWRKIDPVTDGFAQVDGHTVFEVRTNDNGSIRVRGIPGEFEYRRLEPGVYALDSVYAILHDRRVNYFAQGIVTGPERPSFRVEAGEAIYLGIWEMNLNETTATGQLWRLDEADMGAAAHAANAVNGNLTLQATQTISAPCAPHRLNNLSQRQVC